MNETGIKKSGDGSLADAEESIQSALNWCVDVTTNMDGLAKYYGKEPPGIDLQDMRSSMLDVMRELRHAWLVVRRNMKHVTPEAAE